MEYKKPWTVTFDWDGEHRSFSGTFETIGVPVSDDIAERDLINKTKRMYPGAENIRVEWERG